MRDAESECEPVIAASNCVLPMPFPSLVSTPEEIAVHVETHLNACGTEVATRAALFCDEYPCLFAVRADAPIEDCQLFGDAIPRADDEGWIVEPIEEPRASYMADAWKTRRARRMEAVHQRLDSRVGEYQAFNSVSSMYLDLLSCQEVEYRIAAMRTPNHCVEFVLALGCDPAPEREGFSRSYISSVYELIDRLEDDCPSFASANHSIDCSQMPCMLGFEPVDDVPWNEMVCDDSALRYEFVPTRNSRGERYIVVPVDVNAIFEDPEIEEEWESSKRRRVFFMSLP